MRLQVRAEVGPVGERPSALGAAEGFLAGVGPDVSLQQPGPRERLPAEDALAGQGVGPDVHLQGPEGGVQLVAVLTREALLVLLLGHLVERHGRAPTVSFLRVLELLEVTLTFDRLASSIAGIVESTVNEPVGKLTLVIGCPYLP